MTVLTAVQDASTVLGLAIPSVLFTDTNRTSVEMRVMVNSCARQILEEYDWSRLKKFATITGNGVLTAFPLAADYDRMVKDSNLTGPSFTYYPTMQISDTNLWLEMMSYPMETWETQWSLFGGNLNILPVLPNLETLSYSYVSNWIVNGTQSTFTADSDTFTLDERLLRLSIIWNWKKSQGQDYAAELQEYQDALGRAIFKDPGTRQTIYSGRGRRFPTGQSFP